MKIEGNWHSGFAYDVHTVSSEHLGYDAHGHNIFDNKRSEMGELLYQLKYRGDTSGVKAIVGLLDRIKGIETFDCLVPVPATNKQRKVQPVPLITEALGKRRKVEVISDNLINEGAEELKGITDPVERNERLQEALSLRDPSAFRDKKVLIVDDLYRSGSTLRIATSLLLEEGEAAKVSVLAMTKTRSNR
ncbi:MAG TPA: ComF family protein [Planctomycetes bacterium]|uniref:ComF family protein n=1 Tax=Henriciella sp. TaxID=1968823 RepID=UPI0017B18AC6|nr:phosphoribosyltransferase family protein [Henriciella sp.]HIG21757.1 ComF family protein [Henriciella sp.]HIM29746.1 ComF family protein [Planctomycetota bacterium]